MKGWMQSLSLYSQNHKTNINLNEDISDEIVKLRRELVKYDINYRSFIFNNIPKYLNVDSYEECIRKLKEIKKYLDEHDDTVRKYLILESNKIIDEKYTGTLAET